ncbi:MAG: hypothetical protein [Microvirus sp.]|nr:MAG: hypothetical protein [Microvirus sp.]
MDKQKNVLPKSPEGNKGQRPTKGVADTPEIKTRKKNRAPPLRDPPP